MTNHTKEIARFIADLSSNRIPENVRARTLMMIKDGSGALIAAANPDYSTGRKIAAHVKALGVPVFDIISLLTWFHAGLRPRRFEP